MMGGLNPNDMFKDMKDVTKGHLSDNDKLKILYRMMCEDKGNLFI